MTHTDSIAFCRSQIPRVLLFSALLGLMLLAIAGDHPVAEVFINSSSGGKKLNRTLDEKHNDITFGGVPAMLSFIDQGSDMLNKDVKEAHEKGILDQLFYQQYRKAKDILHYLTSRNHPLVNE